MDRLTAADLAMLGMDDAGWPGDIGAVAILDGRSLVDADGRFRIDEVRTKIGQRLPHVPRFGQILYRPRRGLGWPLWVDAYSVDLDAHVGVLALPEEAGDAEVLAACERLRRRPFDPARPRWAMWFMTGLPDGKIALYMRVHHAIADGVAGVATLGSFLDLTAHAPDPAEAFTTPAPAPTSAQLFADNVARRMREFARAISALVHPVDAVRSIRRTWPAISEMFADGKAPRTSLNRPIGRDRRMAVIRGRLDVTKTIAHAHDAKVNDVLMSAVAAGLHDLLVARGEPVDDIVLRAFVPVSLHGSADDAKGNVDGAMVVPLPIGMRDHIRRLEAIAAVTAERKKTPRPAGESLFRNVVLQRAFLRYARRQRRMNFYAANVPGPPIEMYFAGARILELFPIVPLTTNISIGLGALSYANQFNITVVADRELCPDVDVFVDGMQNALEAMAGPVLVSG